MKRKVLSLFLACILLVAVLAACAKTTDTEESTPPESAPAVSEEPTPVPPPEYSEITVEIFDRGTDGGKTDCTNNYYTDWIKSKVLEDENIGVTFQAVSRWEETDQLNNLMAAGNAPDVCLTYSTDLISNYRDLGGLTDLAPYIDSHLSVLKDFLGPDLAVPGRDLIQRDLIPETGAVFSIPGRRMNVARINTFIRKDWLDALNMPLPTTTDEFVDALRAFKDQDPGGVGNVIPFGMTSDVRWRADNLLFSFVTIDPADDEKEYWVNTVIDRHYLLPGYKEGVRLLNQMYNEGLIDPDFPLYEDDVTFDNLTKQGVVGAFIHNWDQPYRDSPGLLKDLLVNVPDAEIVSIDPFVNANGVTKKLAYDSAGVRFFIPATSQNVDGALRYINWLSRVENRSYLQLGDEGVTYEMQDGVPKLLTTDTEKIMNSWLNIDYTMMINGLDLGDAELNKEATAAGYAVDSELIVKAYDDAMRNSTPGPVIPVPLSAAGPVTQVLTDKGKEWMANAITCSPDDFEAEWEEGKADWLASGAQDVIDERAVKYDEYMAQ
jgi:putative aldouronate transport system substrate-binding protein